MRHKTFGEFVDKKKRETIKHLKLIKKLLEHHGMKVDSFTSPEDEEEEPYIFCHNTAKSGSFDGIRIYEIGGQPCFRIQKESKTHPYGSAYPLPIESMFYDFMSDNSDQKKSGQKVINAVGKEIKKFFEKSGEADKERYRREMEGQGDITMKSTGTDYSSLVMSKVI